MRRRAQIEVRSTLAADAATVWARVVTPAGINDELRPLLRMTVPRGRRGFEIEEAVPGERIGRCWILLGGVLPCEFDDLTLARVELGRGFLERSTMLSQRLWEHERRIEPRAGGGCEIADRVAWEPRLPFPGALLAPLIAALFRHRHRRLRRRFGGTEPASARGAGADPTI